MGIYTISYTATDNSGNEGSAERVVQIVPTDTDYLEKWSSHIGTENQYESFEDLAVIDSGKIYAVGKSSNSSSSDEGLLYRGLSANAAVGDSSAEQVSSRGLITSIDDKDGSTIWSLTADESKASILYSVASDSDGNLVGAGSIESSQTTTNALILKLDSDGNELWRKEFGGADSDFLADLAIDNEDNIYVIAIRGSIGSDLVDNYGKASLLKYNSDGDLLNTIELAPAYPFASFDHNRYGIVIDSNNNVYVTGYIITPTIWKIDQNGVIQWTNVFPEGTVGFKYVHKILLRDDFLYAIGYWSSEEEPYYDYGLLVKLDSDGNTILDVRYLGSGSIGARFQDFAINADGTITAVGYAHFTDSPENFTYHDRFLYHSLNDRPSDPSLLDEDGIVVTFDENGNDEDAPSSDRFQSIVSNGDGNISIVGSTFQDYSDAWILNLQIIPQVEN